MQPDHSIRMFLSPIRVRTINSPTPLINELLHYCIPTIPFPWTTRYNAALPPSGWLLDRMSPRAVLRAFPTHGTHGSFGTPTLQPVGPYFVQLTPYHSLCYSRNSHTDNSALSSSGAGPSRHEGLNKGLNEFSDQAPEECSRQASNITCSRIECFNIAAEVVVYPRHPAFELICLITL